MSAYQNGPVKLRSLLDHLEPYADWELISNGEVSIERPVVEVPKSIFDGGDHNVVEYEPGPKLYVHVGDLTLHQPPRPKFEIHFPRNHGRSAARQMADDINRVLATGGIVKHPLAKAIKVEGYETHRGARLWLTDGPNRGAQIVVVGWSIEGEVIGQRVDNKPFWWNGAKRHVLDFPSSILSWNKPKPTLAEAAVAVSKLFRQHEAAIPPGAVKTALTGLSEAVEDTKIESRNR